MCPGGGGTDEEVRMLWSTRELADLADTTINTVRHL
jgi:hypothetical protein